MWQVESRFGAARSTLFIVVGVNRVECGVLRGQGRRARWVQETLQEVAIPAGAIDEQTIQAVQAIVHNLQSLAALPRIAEIRVVVADAWLALDSAPWSSGFKRSLSAVGCARAWLSEAGYDIESADTIRIDDAPFEQPRLAVAYPAKLLTTFHDVARRFNARLTSVLPLSAAAWAVTQSRARGDSGSSQPAIAVLDDGLTLFCRSRARRGGRLSDVTVRREGGNRLAANDLSAAWSRLGLRDSQQNHPGELMALDLCGSTDPSFNQNRMFNLASVLTAGATAPNFDVSSRLLLASRTAGERLALDAVTAPARPSPWQWLVLIAAVLFAGTLGTRAVQRHQLRDALVALSGANAAIVRPAPPTAVWTRAEIVRVQAVNEAIRELNLPIAAILQALQPPRDIRVALVSVDAKGAVPEGQATDGRTSSVKVVAEALSGADMARYVAFVGERPPFTAAYLVSHEINDAVPEKPYRFTMNALWTEQ